MYSPLISRCTSAPAVAVIAGLASCGALSVTRAASPLGLYVGGAAGSGQVAASIPYTSIVDPSGTEFKGDHTAFELMLGLHPVAVLGAEVQYVDLGHPSGAIAGYPANASVRGETAFGLVYLPLPIPTVDVYGKAGVAHLDTSVGGSFPVGCGIACSVPFQLNRTTSDFAMGAGAQLHFGDWAIRAEYERFDAAGANPSLAVVGFTWTLP